MGFSDFSTFVDMFSLQQITGLHLPEKTFCLTFDDGPGETLGDGPGPKTLRLANYLREESIPATFFCVGRFIQQYPAILSELNRLGHFIGNHTYHHPDMKALFVNGQKAACLEEIKSTDDLIRNIIPERPVYFRAPYGQWTPEMSVFLNKEFTLSHTYVGPFYWEVNGNDYAFWDRQLSAEECAAAYLVEIEKTNRGLFLMHDSTSDIENMRLNNRTYETVKLLVPVLKERGFTFIGIDKL